MATATSSGVGSGRPGWARRVRVGAGALVLLGASSLAPTALPGSGLAAADPALTITVTPDVGLRDGDTVTIEVAGLGPNGFGLVSQCPSGAVDLAQCKITDGVEADDTGLASTVTSLRALLVRAGLDPVDCRVPGACEEVVWYSGPDGEVQSNARTPLGFDPSAPLLPEPTISVTPDSGLVDGQSVRVQGADLRAGPVAVSQCVPTTLGGGCRFLAVLDPTGGTVDVSVEVRALIRSYVGDDETETLVDCRTVEEPCSLQIWTSSGDVARTPLRFDPDGPLRPAPTIEVEPASGVADGSRVTVTGSGFTPRSQPSLRLCAVGGDDSCDDQSAAPVIVDGDGRFSAELEVYGDFTFTEWSSPEPVERAVDCREAPGCEVVAFDWEERERAAAPVGFGPRRPRERFRDPVFTEVDITRDVVYRSTVDFHGNAVDLKLDVYEPRGDTASRRPAALWIHGGFFSFGDRDQLAAFAADSARRGYVGVTLQYRLRPGTSTTDWGSMAEAAHDAHDDAVAALAWLRDHGGRFRIDPAALVVAGYSAGGVMAWNLAYPPPGWLDPGPIAAVVPLAGLAFGAPSPGAPPVIAFHATDDEVVPVGPPRATCAAAREVGDVCTWVEYPNGGHLFGLSEQRGIARQTYDFLADQVLGPAGYLSTTTAPPLTLDPRPPRPTTTEPPPPPSTTTEPPPPSTSSTTAPIPTTSVPGTSSLPAAPSTDPPRAGGGRVGPAAGAQPRSARPRYTG